MATGQVGRNGVHVALLVEVEIKHKPELAVIHHLAMEASTVVQQIHKQYPKHAIFKFAQSVRISLSFIFGYKIIFKIHNFLFTVKS